MRSTSSVYACVNWSLDLGAVDSLAVVYFSYLRGQAGLVRPCLASSPQLCSAQLAADLAAMALVLVSSSEMLLMAARPRPGRAAQARGAALVPQPPALRTADRGRSEPATPPDG